MDIIKRIKQLDSPKESSLAFARDIFLFSFYTRGRLFIKWEPCMQELVERYGEKHTPYLLSLIRRPGENERRQYLNESHRIARYLKVIGKSLGLSSPLTMYVARHAWASIAKSKNIPISVISESMGHDSEKTTRLPVGYTNL